MTPKRILYRIMVRLLEQITMRRSFRSCRSNLLSVESLPASNRQCDLITVAFNHVKTIEQQIYFVRKYIQGDYNYVVTDNSTDKAASKEIEALCMQNGVSYVRLPKNYLTKTRGGSYSHGTALNWIYRHIIQKRQPRYFGFIDHDLFPIRPVDPVETLVRQPLYGYLKEREVWWYLWAGFCFFRFDFVRHRKIDFLPAKPGTIYLDTGGGNWYSIYSQLDKNLLSWASYRYELSSGYPESDWSDRTVEYLDDTWIHTIGASNWYGDTPDLLKQRENAVRKILENYL
ncbi:hypothetical protein FACS1894182_01850 [Bacteroidia bacterium]|nr:hypothetical protein FACS1894182_01850 [Bacteroidia bacterium]